MGLRGNYLRYHVPRLAWILSATGEANMIQQCPVCGIVCPPEAQRCYCGYDFTTRRPVNSLGTTGLLLAVAGLIIVVGMVGVIEWVSWDEKQSWERRRALAPDGRTWKSAPIAQALLFGAGICTGGIVNLIGLGLSVWGLWRRPQTIALWGVAVSLLGLALVLGWC